MPLAPPSAGPCDLPTFDCLTFPECRVPYPGRPSRVLVRFFRNGFGLRLFLRGSALSNNPTTRLYVGKRLGAADIPLCYGPQVGSPPWPLLLSWLNIMMQRGLCHLSLPEIRCLLSSQVSYPIEPDNYRSRTFTGGQSSFSGCTRNFLFRSLRHSLLKSSE